MLLGLRLRRFATVLVCLLMLTATQAVHASPGLTFHGLVQTLNTGGAISLSSPSDMVVDPAGNIYITDTGNSRIVEVSVVAQYCLSAYGSCSPQNQTSICCLRLRRIRTEDRVCVLCQPRNKPMGASGVASVAQPVTSEAWQPAHE
ncbi:MAG: hypothetical protein JWQ42_2946 [Edaphobacter sp.]|nr:hypothetical protein [Edaphobacter sp.]